MTSPRLFARTARLFGLICFGLGLTAAAVAAEAARRAFDIPRGDAFTTLKQFATQADARLLYSVEDVKGVTTNAVKGSLTAREALRRLVADTPISPPPEICATCDLSLRS